MLTMSGAVRPLQIATGQQERRPNGSMEGIQNYRGFAITECKDLTYDMIVAHCLKHPKRRHIDSSFCTTFNHTQSDIDTKHASFPSQLTRVLNQR